MQVAEKLPHVHHAANLTHPHVLRHSLVSLPSMTLAARLLLVLGIAGFASAAVCPTEERLCSGNLDLTTDPSGLCTRINGTVTISEAITFPLSCVNRIDGDLVVLSNSVLNSNLQGLETVQHVSGNLWVIDTQLQSIAGLEGLTKVDGDVKIIGNAALQNISALAPLQEVIGTFVLEDNAVIADLTGFSIKYLGLSLMVRLLQTRP